MGEDIRFFPADQIEFGAGREEFEAGGCVVDAAVADQPLGKLVAQRMQIEHIGGGIFRAAPATGSPLPNPTTAAPWRCRRRAFP